MLATITSSVVFMPCAVYIAHKTHECLAGREDGTHVSRSDRVI